MFFAALPPKTYVGGFSYVSARFNRTETYAFATHAMLAFSRRAYVCVDGLGTLKCLIKILRETASSFVHVFKKNAAFFLASEK